MNNSSKDSPKGNSGDVLKETPPEYDFELPIAPEYNERPPKGTWEDGYRLSLMGLEMIKHRPEIFEQRAQRMCDVEFIL
jgi:hypothetical protein